MRDKLLTLKKYVGNALWWVGLSLGIVVAIPLGLIILLVGLCGLISLLPAGIFTYIGNLLSERKIKRIFLEGLKANE